MFDIFHLSGGALKNIAQINIQSHNIPQNDSICSILLFQRNFICGHESGILSLWQPGANPFLTLNGATKIHNGPINKLYLKKYTGTNANGEAVNANYILTCSLDGSIKIYDGDKGFSLIKELPIAAPVYDLVVAKDINEKDRFLVTVNNGTIQVKDENFEPLFMIPSRHGYSGINKRCLVFENPERNQNKGNILICTDGFFIDINYWINEANVQRPNNSHPQQPHHQHHPHGNHRGNQRGFH